MFRAEITAIWTIHCLLQLRSPSMDQAHLRMYASQWKPHFPAAFRFVKRLRMVDFPVGDVYQALEIEEELGAR